MIQESRFFLYMIQSIQPFFFGFTKPRFKVSLRATAKAEVGSGLMGMILGWWMGAMKRKKTTSREEAVYLAITRNHLHDILHHIDTGILRAFKIRKFFLIW